MTDGLHAVTLWQPWGLAIAKLGKPVENRSWDTAYRGEIAVHAGMRWDPAGERSRLVHDAWLKYRDTLPPDNVALPFVSRDSLWVEFGAVVAIADLTGVCREQVDGRDCDCGPWAATGRQYHWKIDNVRALRHAVPCPGHQRIWHVPPEVAEKVRAEL